MKSVLAKGFFPFEPDDKVLLKDGTNNTIKNIRMLIYVRDIMTGFEVMLEDGKWHSSEIIESRII